VLERCLTRLTPSLLAVMVAAKTVALAGHHLSLSWWSPIAFFWHDAAVVLAFAAIAKASAKIGVVALYLALTLYAVLNVPVTRVVSTPLTWTMWRAARGPLSDSMLMYVTWDNVLLMSIVAAIAILLPFALPRTRYRLSYLLVAIIALGPLAASRVDTRGFERNAWSALVTTMPWPTRERTWTGRERTPVEPERTSIARERSSPRVGSAAGRNIVMVSLESTGAQYLGLYGAAPDVMPNLTALAGHALVFDHAYAVYPESIKGLFSILCSAYPAFDKPAESYGDVPCVSLADLLAGRGYRTALFHSGRFGYLGMDAIVRGRGYEVLEDAGDIGGRRESSFGVDEPSTVARILRWIDTLRTGDRFFVTYLPIAGHHPYETPARGPFPERELIDRYRNALAYGDAALGELVAGLRRRGLEEKTLWIVFGDHGEAFGQHDGNYGHTFQIFDENVHVPFVVSASGLLRGQIRRRTVVSLIDTAPTILDLLGEKPPAVYEGRSMLDPWPRTAFFFTDYSLRLLGMRDERYKTIYDIDSGRVRLFDMEADPRETTDIAPQHPERAVRFDRRSTSLR
jgi:glucan phosphoethanolaminetransferase (alkaline phosphatase superfamily)